MNKKVLLLTASYGTGHNTAIKFVEKTLKELYPSIETKIVDFLHISKKPETLTMAQKVYNFCMEKPQLWDIFFIVTNNSCSSVLLNYLLYIFNYKKIEKLFNEYEPDILVSAHPYWNVMALHYKKNVVDIPYVCIVTDSVMIHKSWINKKVDYYCVIDNDTKITLINHGIRNIFVTGFPVNPELSKPVNKEKILSELNLEPNRITILITIGLGAVERFVNIIDFLRLKEEYNFQLIIVAGKYKEIYDSLKIKEYKVPTAIIGWTDRMADFIRVSDLVICKGGGAIVSESLSAGKPVLIPLFVPGQERGNVYIIEKYKLGFYEENIDKVFSLLEDIISQKLDLTEYKLNIEKHIEKTPAVNIAKLIHKILSLKK